MAIELAAVYVPITPSLRGAATKIQTEIGRVDVSQAGRNIGESLGGNISGSLRKFLGAAVAATAVASLPATALAKGFQRLNAIDTARAKLTGLGNDAATVSTVMENSLSAVRGTAFGLGDAATVAAQLVAAQIQPGEQLQGVLKSVTNSAAAAGTGLDEMGSIYAKVASLGKAQNDVLQQVADRGIPIYQSLANQLGVTADEVFKMASEGKIGFADFQQAMTTAAGTVADELGNTVGGAWSNFIASLGRIGAGLLGGVFPKIAPSIKGITAAMAPLEAISGVIGEKVGTVLAPAMDKLVGFISGDVKVGWITEVTGGVRAMIQAFKDGGNDLTSAGFAGVLESVGLAARSIVDSGILAFASPFSIVLTVLKDVLPQVASSLTDVGSQLTLALGSALPFVVEALGSLTQLLATSLPVVLPPLVDLIRLLGGGLATAITAVGPALGPLTVAFLAGAAAMKLFGAVAAVQAAGGLLKWIAATRIGTAAQVVFNAVMSANPIGLIITAIAALVAGLIYFFTQTELGQAIWAEFTRFLGEAWANIVSVATTVFTALGDFFTSVWNGIVKVVTDVWNNVAGFLGPIFEFIATLIRVYVETWVNIIIVMAAILVTIWNGIVGVVTTVWNAIVDFLTPIVQFIVGLVVGYFTTLWNFWSAVWQGIVDFFTGIWNGLIAFLVPIVATVVGAVQGPVQALSDWWNGVWSAISGFFSGIWSTMVTTVSNAIGQITGFIGGIYDTVMNVLSDAGKWLLNAGADVVRGFWEGISSMGGWLFDQIGGFFDGVIGWAKDTLGIQSPSRVFRAEVGQMVGEGMALGLADSQSTVQHAMDSLLTVPSVPMVPSMAGAGYEPAAYSGGGGRSGAGVTQNNYFAEMDPEVAIEASGQRLAAVARRNNA